MEEAKLLILQVSGKTASKNENAGGTPALQKLGIRIYKSKYTIAYGFVKDF